MEKFDLHLESHKLIEVFGNLNVGQTMPEKRDYFNNCTKTLSGYKRPFDGQLTEIVVPNNEDGLPCFVYKPNNVADNPAILVYFHGGGLLSGSRETADSICNEFSNLAGCIVVNVEYRLSPENKFPIPIDDAVAATEWVMENKTKIGALSTSKVGVSGDSSGGYLAASVTHELKVDFQILIYPMVTKFGEYSRAPNAEKYRNGPILNRKAMEFVDENYIPENLDKNHPRLNPICRPHFETLPPALVLLAEHDPLVDCGTEYAQKLQLSGVSTELHVLRGAVHCFFGSFVTCPTLCEEAFGKCTKFIQNYQNVH